MNAKLGRELTTLEYIILGILSIAPQSGYSVIGALETGVHRWSASPGAVYPALKRLEHQDVIGGTLEVQYEMRPRKVYNLTPLGENLLDNWLRASLTGHEIMEEHDIVLIKFMFTEKRMSREDVLAWLDAYEHGLETYDATRRIVVDMMINVSSTHQQLLSEATFMELKMQREWIRLAQQRLRGETSHDEAKHQIASTRTDTQEGISQ